MVDARSFKSSINEKETTQNARKYSFEVLTSLRRPYISSYLQKQPWNSQAPERSQRRKRHLVWNVHKCGRRIHNSVEKKPFEPIKPQFGHGNAEFKSNFLLPSTSMTSNGHSKRKARETSNLQITLLVLCTNLVSVFLFSGPFHWIPLQYLHPDYDSKYSPNAPSNWAAKEGSDPNDPWGSKGGSMMPAELREFMAPQKLPFGNNRIIGSDSIYLSLGQACAFFKDEINKYMTYNPGQLCPEDETLAQKLIVRGCEPLPRRRCIARSSPNYKEPDPFPQSLWTTPPNSSVVWSAYTCKDYACLIARKHQKGFDDCKDCFDLQFREKTRWLKPSGSFDFAIDEVLTLKNGTIRIGLDIGGGTATFAVRMRERNVTIVTTSMNFNGPFNNFIASRGVVPLYLAINQRLPFFENTLDIVHSMHVLSNWIPANVLEFILYDIYRVLRPGGVFWLDRFFCLEDQKETYVPMIEKLGFNKLRWSVGPKLDRGPNYKEMYISALLEKPLERHS